MGLSRKQRAERKRWLDAANLIHHGQIEGIVCPRNQDAILSVDLIPVAEGGPEEYRLSCPGCGAVEFLLVGR